MYSRNRWKWRNTRWRKRNYNYSIIVIKQAEVEPIVADIDEGHKQEENSFFTKDTLKIIIVSATSVIAILGIIFAVIEYRYGKNKEEMYFDITYFII